MQKRTHLDLEIILTETIIEYLDNAISFQQFLTNISSLQKDPISNKSMSLKKSITRLLSLSKYTENPQTNREHILNVIYQAVTEF